MPGTNEAFSHVKIDAQLKDQGWDVVNPNAVRFEYVLPNKMQCPHAADLPALRWKLANLQTFSKRRPRDFEYQARALGTRLG